MVHQVQQLGTTLTDGAQNGMKADRPGGPQVLLALARDQSVEGRRALAFSLADLFGGCQPGLSERSRELAAQILDRLIRAFETDLRRELAERLAVKPDVPRSLILLLANDEIEVARPVLLESELLRPEDLIAIIASHGLEHQVTIAMRRSLTEAVCEALVGTDNVAVIETLLRNQDAPIRESTMAYLVEEAHWVETYREPLVQRRELQPPLARRLYALVSAALRAHILEHFDINAEELDDEIEKVVVSRTGPADAQPRHDGGEPPDRSDGEVESEAQPQAITAQLLIKLLRDGERARFEQSFAEFSGLRSPRLEEVLYGPDGKGLAVTCRALGMDKNSFAVIVFLCRQGGPGEQAGDPRAVAQVIDYFSQMEPSAAQARLRQWTRDPDYVTAIEDLAASGGAQR